jgi:hypothetical protein
MLVLLYFFFVHGWKFKRNKKEMDRQGNKETNKKLGKKRELKKRGKKLNT